MQSIYKLRDGIYFCLCTCVYYELYVLMRNVAASLWEKTSFGTSQNGFVQVHKTISCQAKARRFSCASLKAGK